MKLTSHIARYIRRCGYAVALTVATASFAFNAKAAQIHITSIGSDGKTTDTSALEKAIATGELTLSHWCIQRPSNTHDYQFLVWNVDNPSYSHNEVLVDHAIRPSVQDAVTQIALGYDAEGNKILGYDAEGNAIISEDDREKIVYNAGVSSMPHLLYHDTYKEADGITVTGSTPHINRVIRLSYIGARSLSPAEGAATNCGDSVVVGSRNFERYDSVSAPIHVHDNKLSITNSGFHLAVGAYSQYGDVFRNETYAQDVRFSDDIIGAFSNNGNAYENTVTMFRAQSIAGIDMPELGSYGINNAGKVLGAFASKGHDATNNKVFIWGSYIKLYVQGVMAGRTAENNEIFISRSVIGDGANIAALSRYWQEAVIGAQATGNSSNAVAKNNSVIIDDTYDGYVPEEIIDGTQAGERTATLPDVTTLHMGIYAGVANKGYGNDAETGGAHNNTVRIIGATRTSTQPATLGQEVTTTIEGNIVAGQAGGGVEKLTDVDNRELQQAASATGNVVDISGATIKKTNSLNDKLSEGGCIYGGYVSAPLSLNINGRPHPRTPGNANNNLVMVTDSSVEDNIYGGWNSSLEHIDATDENNNPIYDENGHPVGYGDASENALVFDHVETNNNDLVFYGGWSEGGKTNYNNVYLNNPDWSMSNTYLHGGWGTTGHELDSAADYQTNTRQNWLHVQGFQGEIKGFDHFEEVHFVVTPEVDRTKPMLTLTGDQNNPDEATSMVINKAPEAGEPTLVHVTADISAIADELKPGDIIPLFGHKDDTNSIAGTKDIDKDSVVDDTNGYRRGVTRRIELDTEFLEVNDEADLNDEDMAAFLHDGVIRILGKTEEATPESKALVEGRIATLTLNNMGGNLLAEQGIDSACRALEGTGEPADANHYVAVEQNGKGGVAYAPKDELVPGNRLFFAMSGAHNKVDSGSDVDVDGTNALVGISRGFLAKRALTLGAFMETGWGKYHTHNNFGEGAYVPTVRGTGETSYVGAGALLRYRLDNLNKKLAGFSLDASVRAGRQETDYSTPDLVDDKGNYAAYEHESDYIAGHVGVNYTFQPTEKLAALVYARYLWTHVSSDEGIVCGETVTFEDMHSNRIRLGSRLSWQATEKWTPYLGAAYEWECSGTARANTHGMGITAPSMRGGSVIGEIGAVWQPSLTRALWIEGALQGSVGKNENYGAKLGISIGF